MWKCPLRVSFSWSGILNELCIYHHTGVQTACKSHCYGAYKNTAWFIRPSRIPRLVQREQFLDMSHRVTSGPTSIHYTKHNRWTYEFPFIFVIPPATENFSHGVPAACRVLPPSFRIGKCPTRIIPIGTCLRLAIQYELNVSVGYQEYSFRQWASPRQVSCSREIHILPYTEACPPTEISDFPGEFLMKVTVPLRNRLLTNQIGIATVVVREPDPLVYTLETPEPKTECDVKLFIEGAQLLQKRLEGLTISAKSRIRAKTFYSGQPITRIPIQADLAEGSGLHLRDDVSKLKHYKFRKLSWIPYHEPLAQFEEHLATYQITLIPNLQASGKWLASFHLPIVPRDNLTPSFCSTLVARSYSFQAHFVLEGLASRPVDIEVPLQVIYPFQKQLSEGTKQVPRGTRDI